MLKYVSFIQLNGSPSNSICCTPPLSPLSPDHMTLLLPPFTRIKSRCNLSLYDHSLSQTKGLSLSLLHIACALGLPKLVGFLLSHGASPTCSGQLPYVKQLLTPIDLKRLLITTHKQDQKFPEHAGFYGTIHCLLKPYLRYGISRQTTRQLETVYHDRETIEIRHQRTQTPLAQVSPFTTDRHGASLIEFVIAHHNNASIEGSLFDELITRYPSVIQPSKALRVHHIPPLHIARWLGKDAIVACLLESLPQPPHAWVSGTELHHTTVPQLLSYYLNTYDPTL